MILETERLILRPFRDSDLEPFLAYRSDPEVARYQGWDMPYTAEKAAEFIAEMKNSPPRPPGEWYQLAIELKANRRMIGDCAFYLLAEDQRQAEIGYTLSRNYQGSGYGAEAVRRLLGYLFDELQLHRVRANTDAENTASARLLERVGMRREAHHIQSLWFKGRWSSEYWYALLRDEWSEFSG
jgi:RimJ/RimL family protein N-acetyltransferase